MSTSMWAHVFLLQAVIDTNPSKIRGKTFRRPADQYQLSFSTRWKDLRFRERRFCFCFYICCVSIPPCFAWLFRWSILIISAAVSDNVLYTWCCEEETMVYRPITFWADSILNPHLWLVRLNSVITWRTDLAWSLRAQRSLQKGYAWTNPSLY